MQHQEELKKIIKRKLRSGYPYGEIRHDLMQQGMPDEDIDAIFNSLAEADHSNSLYRKQDTGGQGWLLAAAGVGITGTALWSVKPGSSFTTLLIILAIVIISGLGLFRVSRHFRRKENEEMN